MTQNWRWWAGQRTARRRCTFFQVRFLMTTIAGGDAHLLHLVKESTRMDSQPDDKNRPEILQMMTTEHYNLQSGRSLALSDANGRAGLFLGTVSSSLIALAFVGNITHVGTQLGTAF